MQTITIPVERIVDWPSFHNVFQRALGFPDFHGRNMNAWMDCVTSVDEPPDGLTTITVEVGGILVVRIDAPFEFRRRCPEQYDAVIECSASVNYRRAEIGQPPVLALLLAGTT
jgi:Barstar (barnase inhibitor)